MTAIHGSMFNPNDVENAPDNPFELPEGRSRVVFSESGPDTIKIEGEEKAVWKVVLRDPDDDADSYRRQDVLFFLDGDAKQKKQTDSNIKKMLSGSEIPVNQWEKISANPQTLVGKFAIVDLQRAKKSNRLFVKEWFADTGASNASSRNNVASATPIDVSKVYDL
jgi:hypothetical protein